MRLFFFGSLLDPDLFETVVGRPMASVAQAPARLEGWSARRVREEDYPILVPAPGGGTAGRIFAGLSWAEIDRVQFFEGDEYDLSPVTVGLAPDRAATVLAVSPRPGHPPAAAPRRGGPPVATGLPAEDGAEDPVRNVARNVASGEARDVASGEARDVARGEGRDASRREAWGEAAVPAAVRPSPAGQHPPAASARPAAAGAAVPLTAHAYLSNGQLSETAEPWRLDHWQRTHKAEAVTAARRWMTQYGRLPLAEAEARWDAIRAEARAALAGA